MKKNYYCKFFGFLLLFFCSLLVNAQQIKVSGKVTDEKGEPLSGASVSDEKQQNSTLTDVNGNFTINALPNAVLKISFIGMQTQKVAVQGRTFIPVKLATDNNRLNEVVVVGYGTVKKADLTGAVGSVKGEQLARVATPDVIQALQGRISGVSVTANTGEPGSGTKIRIRGLGSINGGSPIYVVDGYQTGDISYLAPNDIQGIDVLKDASATAIYGSRGANGVVMITTKKGNSGPVVFNLDTYTGFQEAWHTIPMVNASQYANLVLEGYSNDGQSVPADISTRLDYVKDGNFQGTNWQDAVMQKGIIQNYTLSAKGGSDRNTFRVSGTYFQQDGIVRNSGMKKYFLNFNNDYKVNNWFTAGVTADFIHFDKTYYNGDPYSGVLTNALAADPLTPVWDTNTDNWGRPDISYASNPARIVTFLKNNKGYGTSLIGNVWAKAQIIQDLSFKTQFGTTYGTSHNKSYNPQFYVDNVEQNAQSSLYEARGASANWIWTNYLDYNKQFGDHSFTLLAGAELQNNNYTNFSTTAYDVPADADLQYLSSAQSTDYKVSSGQGSNSLRSFFGRLNYSYKSKYLVTATVRNDGSSKFLGKHRFGTFPSFAVAWNVSEESFIKDLNVFDQLKVRAGWGQVGNEQAAPNYGYVVSVGGDNLYVFNNTIVQGFAPSVLSNPELEWETSEQTDIGLDAWFMKGSLTFTADWFDRKTNNMIVAVPIPMYVGSGAPTVNAGSLSNKGFEFSLGYQGGNALKYSFNVNTSFIRNKLLSLGGGPAQSSGGVGKLGNTTRVEVGKPIPYFYGLKTDGIFHSQEEVQNYTNADGNLIQPNASAGDVKFLDLNQDGIISDEDRADLGNPYPKLQFGFNTDLSYKRFDIRVFLQGVEGNKIVNNLTYSLENVSNSGGGWLNFDQNRLNRWTVDHPENNEPKMTIQNANNNMRFSDRYVEDGSYIRMKNLQIGYTLPQKFVSKLQVNNARIFLASDNLFTITRYSGFDPEISDYYTNPFFYGVDVGNYPQSRTFRFGVNINF